MRFSVSLVTFSVPKSDDTQVEPTPVEAPGAVGIGIIGLGLMCSLLGAIIILDLATIHRHFIYMKRNLEHLWKKGSSKRKRSERHKYTADFDDENNLEHSSENNAYSASPTSASLQPEEYYNNWNHANKRVPRHNIPMNEDDASLTIENNLNIGDGKDYDASYSNKTIDEYSDFELGSTRL